MEKVIGSKAKNGKGNEGQLIVKLDHNHTFIDFNDKHYTSNELEEKKIKMSSIKKVKLDTSIYFNGTFAASATTILFSIINESKVEPILEAIHSVSNEFYNFVQALGPIRLLNLNLAVVTDLVHLPVAKTLVNATEDEQITELLSNLMAKFLTDEYAAAAVGNDVTMQGTYSDEIEELMNENFGELIEDQGSFTLGLELVPSYKFKGEDTFTSVDDAQAKFKEGIAINEVCDYVEMTALISIGTETLVVAKTLIALRFNEELMKGMGEILGGEFEEIANEILNIEEELKAEHSLGIMYNLEVNEEAVIKQLEVTQDKEIIFENLKKSIIEESAKLATKVIVPAKLVDEKNI